MNRKEKALRFINTIGRTIKGLPAAVMGLYDRFEKRFERPLSLIRKMQSRPFLYSIYHSFVIYLIVEMLSRRSPVSAVSYLFSDPLVFMYNWLLVLLTMTLALLFRKRGFAFTVISGLWLILGVTNCVLLGFRTTPLNFMDFRTFKDVMGIINVYLAPWQIALIVAGLVVVLASLLLMFLRTPKENVKFTRSMTVIVSVALVAGLATSLSVSAGKLQTTFHNIQEAYKSYGFAYCFSASVVGRGISRPDSYSQEYMNGIVEKINAAAGEEGAAEVIPAEHATKENPNIIIVQMESFFDVNHLKNVTFSENPVPVFTELKEKYSSGILLTPSFGAGTANTEFEVNTGMSLASFGPGEYPYSTRIRQTATESVANDLKAYGYSTHAIHNHTGKFYGRYLVYPNMGFDSFTSVEYMQNIERNPLNWADDSCLTGEITKAMQSTEEPDYVFAVSVQGHGKYPAELIDETQTITAQGFNEEEAVGFDYFINQLHRMDEFIGEMVHELEASDEPTVLVVYGDHLPKFQIEADDMDNGNIYETEYVIWDNFGMAQEDKDLTTYQLYPQVLNLLGMHNGVITRFQQFCQGNDTYYSDLEALQYDILYGKNYVYGGALPFEKTEMRMGIDDVKVTGMSAVGRRLYISGENLTQRSIILINGNEVKTTFLNNGRIACNYGKKIEEGDTVEVVQMSSRKLQLSSAGIWEWYPDGAVQIAEGNTNLTLDRNIEETEEEMLADIKADEDVVETTATV